MREVFAVLLIVASASTQRYSQRYPSSGHISGGFGGSSGHGSHIIFPDDRPIVRPVRPGGIGSNIGVIRPSGLGPTIGSGSVGGGISPIGVVRPSGLAPAGPGSIGGGISTTGVVRPSGVGGSIAPGGVGSIGGGIVPGGVGSTGGINPTTSELCKSQSQVDSSNFGSDYHYSWCHDGDQKYEGQDANQYCRNLGPGWQGVSIEDPSENQFIYQIILAHNLEYIWTSGQRQPGTNNFFWSSGRPFVGLDWSHTGFEERPQPDNSENGIENCLGILNNFYNDGVKWHDIACYHLKPIICERPTHGSPAFG